MKWLERLKSEKAPGAYATKPTKPGFVGFVASPAGLSENSQADAQAANDGEAFEERAGILEFDAGMSRPEAEELAAELVHAAMRACDLLRHGPAAHEEILCECPRTPNHLGLGLLAQRESSHLAKHGPDHDRRPDCLRTVEVGDSGRRLAVESDSTLDA